MRTEMKEPGNGLDLLWGCKAIALELNLNERQTFHLLESGLLPAKKIGARWCATRSALRRHFEERGA